MWVLYFSFWVCISRSQPALSETFVLGYLTGSQRRTGDRQYVQPGLTISGAISFAVDEVNKELAENGSEHRVSFVVAETYGEEETSVLSTARMWRDKVSGFIGPQETCVTEARMAASFNLPMISYFCTQPETSNKKLFRTFGRTRPPSSQIARSVASLLVYFDWRKVALLYRDDALGETGPVAATLLANFRQADIQILLTKTWSQSVQFPYQLEMFNSLVDNTYKNVRIYVILGSSDEHLSLLSALEKRSLLTSGEYQVVGVSLEAYKPDEPSQYLRGLLQKDVDLRMLPAFKGYLGVVPTAPVSMDSFSRKVNEYLVKPPFNFKPTPFKVIPPEAGYLYDAVKLYVKSLLRVLKDGGDPRNGTAIINAIKGVSYLSGLGYQTYIDENGDALGNYTLLAMRSDPSNKNVHGLYPVGVFTSSTNYSSFPEVDFSEEPDWILGRPPLAEPICGFHGEKCLNYTWQKVGIVLGALLLVGAVALFLVYRNWRYEQELDSLLWKLDFRDIQLSEEEGQTGPSTKMTRATHPLMRTSQVSLSSNPDADFRYSAIFTTIGIYKGQVFAIRKVNKKSIDISRAMKKELKMMRDLRHDNINPFIGACTEAPNICIVSEYCARGSLRDILDNESIRLDNMFIASLISDLLRGMMFLHDSPVRYHGRLKPSNCLIDPRWVLKIADYGLRELKMGEILQETESDQLKISEGLLYRAPELLRVTDVEEALIGSQKGDIYSFGIILYELHSRRGPFGETTLSAKEILEKVSNLTIPLFRPCMDIFENNLDYVKDCLTECWAENPEMRPDFKSVRSKLRPMKKGMKPNILDNMMSLMEKYTNDLEALVDERTDQLVVEKKKTEALLHEMLPKSVAEQLKRGQKVEAEQFDSVTIYFSDIVGFTAMSAQSSPLEVVDFLNDLYTCFDSILENLDVYKVETIGDAYMVVSGLPLRNGDQHAAEIASMSLQLIESVRRFRIKHRPDDPLLLRVGIHSGPVCAGVVGLKMPRYCLFGDTVNTASRMESTGVSGRIHISSTTKDLLDRLGGYVLQERGLVRMKGKGEQLTYWLVGEEEDRLKPSTQAGLRSSLKNKRLDPSTRRGTLARCSSLESPKRLRFASADLLEFHKLDSSKDPLLEVIIDTSPSKKSLLDVHTNSEHVRRTSSSCPCIENISTTPTISLKPLSRCHGDCNGNIQIFIDPDDEGVESPLLTS